MKLGPHVLNVTQPGLDWAKRAPIVKALNRTDALKAAPDSAIRVFRQSYENEMDTTDPTGTVNKIVAGLKGYWHKNLYVQIWCGAHPTLAQLEKAVLLCHTNNLKTVGSSWFTGDYTLEDWDVATAAAVDAYAPQCYWGTNGFTPDHALRYRRYWQAGQAPVLILECGRDAVEGGKGGWQKDGLSPHAYANELIAYDAELAKDHCVFGATPFTSGPTPDWKPFDMDPISPLLPTGGNVPTTTFNVGQGVKDLMAAQGDAPQSDEHYVNDANGATFKSETFGSKGLYVWSKTSNKTVILPFH